MPLPTFLIIGAQKSATRWLRTNLGKHPEIYTAPREVEFFNHEWHLGIEWYAQQFPGYRGQNLIGEATPGYMMWNEDPALQAARIDGLLPNVRLIALLRSPVERIYSAFVHFQREGRISPDTSLQEYLSAHAVDNDPLCLVGGSLYAASLESYLMRFGDRLMICRQEDIARDGMGLYKRVLQHVGAKDDDFRPAALGKVRFSNQRPGDAHDVSRTDSMADDTNEGIPGDIAERLLSLVQDDMKRLRELTGITIAPWIPR